MGLENDITIAQGTIQVIATVILPHLHQKKNEEGPPFYQEINGRGIVVVYKKKMVMMIGLPLLLLIIIAGTRVPPNTRVIVNINGDTLPLIINLWNL